MLTMFGLEIVCLLTFLGATLSAWLIARAAPVKPSKEALIFQGLAESLSFDFFPDARALSKLTPQVRVGYFLALRQRSEANRAFLKPFYGLYPYSSPQGCRAQNIVSGTEDEIDWTVFEFLHDAGENGTIKHFIFSARLPIDLPTVTLKPITWRRWIAEHLRPRNLEDEPLTFEEVYGMTSPDPEAAAGLLEFRLRNFLLRSPPSVWEVRGNLILMVKSKVESPEELRESFELLREFVQRIPARYFEKMPSSAHPERMLDEA